MLAARQCNLHDVIAAAGKRLRRMLLVRGKRADASCAAANLVAEHVQHAPVIDATRQHPHKCWVHPKGVTEASAAGTRQHDHMDEHCEAAAHADGLQGFGD